MVSEMTILERIIEPEKPELSRALAEYLLSLDFKAVDHDRMNVLSEKAQRGSLSPEEERELDCYLSMGHFLSLLQSKARITLTPSPRSARPFDRITIDPHIMHGKPCVRGMRVTVSLVVNLVAAGMTTEEIIRGYPYLEPEDIAQCLSYASWAVDEEIMPFEPAHAVSG